MKSPNALPKSGRSLRMRSKPFLVNVKIEAGPSDDTVTDRAKRWKNPISPMSVWVAMRRVQSIPLPSIKWPVGADVFLTPRLRVLGWVNVFRQLR